jgi:hypothetical protein
MSKATGSNIISTLRYRDAPAAVEWLNIVIDDVDAIRNEQ